jgi:hypothetical protein
MELRMRQVKVKIDRDEPIAVPIAKVEMGTLTMGLLTLMNQLGRIGEILRNSMYQNKFPLFPSTYNVYWKILNINLEIWKSEHVI